MTFSDCRDAEKLLMNSINNIRQDKKSQMKEIMKDRNNLNNQIKTYEIILINIHYALLNYLFVALKNHFYHLVPLLFCY